MRRPRGIIDIDLFGLAAWFVITSFVIVSSREAIYRAEIAQEALEGDE